MNAPKGLTPDDRLVDAGDLDALDPIKKQIAELTRICDSADQAQITIQRLARDTLHREGPFDKDAEGVIALMAEHRRAEALLSRAEALVELLQKARLDRGHQLILLFGEVAARGRQGEHDPAADEVFGPLSDLFEHLFDFADKGGDKP